MTTNAIHTTNRIVPCAWLDGTTEQAAAFYLATFCPDGDGRIVATSHYSSSMENPGGRPRGAVLTIELELSGHGFTLLNGGPLFSPNPSVSFFVSARTVEEADRLFAALADGGQVLMPIGAWPWSERYGWVSDRFGVSWQVMLRRDGEEVQRFRPCLMFSGAIAGRAEEAIRQWTRIVPGSAVDTLARYEEGEGPVNMVKHGRFSLAGQECVAMDSHREHGFTFSEALSLQVMCDDQATIDHYWTALAEGGQHGPCGWLKDRFGLSWQIAPTAIDQLLGGDDEAARDRVFAAMLKMGKIDVGALERAFAGG